MSISGLQGAARTVLSVRDPGAHSGFATTSGTSSSSREDPTEKKKKLEEKIVKLLEEKRDQFKDVVFDDEPISMRELRAIIRKMKPGKAPGPDEITTDFVKHLDKEGLEKLRELVNKWWIDKIPPDKATTARVVSLYKKGNPELQENYRPISLLNTYYKIIAGAVQRRLAKALDKLLTKTQFGFREKRSTVDAIFIARRIQELAERRGDTGLMLLLDWEKAFDK